MTGARGTFRLEELGRLIRQLWRAARYASLGLIGVMVFLLVFRVADIVRHLSGIHPLLGWAFLLALLLALAWFVGRPLYRFLRVPVVMRPPKLPPPDERRPKDLVRHLAYLERYVSALRENPEWEGDEAVLGRALESARAIRERAVSASPEELPSLVARVRALEEGDVTTLLDPLDRKAADAIRAEAFRIGVATAASPYGTLDAFVVLWRNANLIARLARIYYGRPSARGTLFVIRDVATATIAGAYLQDLGEIAGDLVGSLAGKTAGFLAGPLMEGCLNGVATLRVGYMAKGRCRSFQAWTPRTAGTAAREALVEAGRQSAGLVTDVVKTVGSGILDLPGKVIGGLVDKVGSVFRKHAPPPAGEPSGA